MARSLHYRVRGKVQNKLGLARKILKTKQNKISASYKINAFLTITPPSDNVRDTWDPAYILYHGLQWVRKRTRIHFLFATKEK